MKKKYRDYLVVKEQNVFVNTRDLKMIMDTEEQIESTSKPTNEEVCSVTPS